VRACGSAPSKGVFSVKTPHHVETQGVGLSGDRSVIEAIPVKQILEPRVGA
jgi:hypothetical protein